MMDSVADDHQNIIVFWQVEVRTLCLSLGERKTREKDLRSHSCRVGEVMKEKRGHRSKIRYKK
jgi:hypothetical protein